MPDNKVQKSFLSPKTFLRIKGKLLDLSHPKVMGILNTTPDSFFDGGRYQNENAIIERCDTILNTGADIIDIGAYSSRPGAIHISEEEEWERLERTLNIIRKKHSEAVISVDSFRSDVVRKAVEYFAADIINDISAGNMDDKMFDTVARLQVPYIMMHIQGNPQTMQQNPYYENITTDILKYFATKIQKLKLKGVADIIIDPGFGFGKTIDHNYELLSHLDDFKITELPVLVGISRKSMIYKFLDIDIENALNGTTALNMYALQKGAKILRVHDVAEAVQTISLFEKLQ